MYLVSYSPEKDMWLIDDYDVTEYGAEYHRDSVFLYHKGLVANSKSLVNTLDEALNRANGNGRFDYPVYYHGNNINHVQKRHYCYVGNVLCELI